MTAQVETRLGATATDIAQPNSAWAPIEISWQPDTGIKAQMAASDICILVIKTPIANGAPFTSVVHLKSATCVNTIVDA